MCLLIFPEKSGKTQIIVAQGAAAKSPPTEFEKS